MSSRSIESTGNYGNDYYGGSSCGLIILGNSGVGKSFLANILLGREAFAHRFAARAVTTVTEYEEITVGKAAYTIFNIPGLIEADQARIETNKCEIDKAFKERPNSLIIYVFGQQGGRIRDEDVVAFNAINDAYPFKRESLMIVINGLEKQRPKNYEGEVITLLEQLIKVQCQNITCFLDMINKDNAQEREILKAKVLQVIINRKPHIHEKEHDIHMQSDQVRMLKEQIKIIDMRFQESKHMYEREIKANQDRYEQMNHERQEEAAYFRRILEEQGQESKDLQKKVLEQEALFRREQEQREKRHQEQMQKAQAQLEKTIREANAQAERAQKAALADASEAHRKSLAQAAAANERDRREQQEEQTRKMELMQTMHQQETAVAAAAHQRSIDATRNSIPKKSSCCFTAGTLIQMADKTEKAIQAINPGDVVLGVDGQSRAVMFLDVEQLGNRCLYGMNGYTPFVTDEHVFLTSEGTKVSINPRASEEEEPSLTGDVQHLQAGIELKTFINGRPSSSIVEGVQAVSDDPELIVFNVVLDSGHSYYANGFAVSDMFPDLSRYPRMFKLLHLLWRSCAPEIDGAFGDILSPQGEDRVRFEALAEQVKYTITQFLGKQA